MKLKKIHIKASFILFFYLIVSKTIFIRFALVDNIFVSYGIPMVYGSISGIIFLYLFSHEDFFGFAKEIEQKEIDKERRWLRMFSRFGKIGSVFFVGTVGGPIFSALTTRLLLETARYRYILVVLVNIPSTLFIVGGARGIANVFL